MSIFAAPAYPGQFSVSERFTPEARGRLASQILESLQDSDNGRNNADGNQADSGRFDLNPPDDSMAGRFRYVVALLNRGRVADALTRALQLLNGPSPVPTDMRLALRDVARTGIQDLRIAGHNAEASAFERLFELQNPKPSLALQQQLHMPVPSFV